MSFLKQLLNPFIEFDEEAKKKEAAKGNTPAATPSAATQPAATSTQPALPSVPPAPPQADVPAHHPLIDGSNNASNTPEQVPTYSPSGTISKPLPEHKQYFEKLI